MQNPVRFAHFRKVRRFSIDTLKIDRSFVSHLDDHEENREIVRTIMMLACNLGMEVIAEGAETSEEVRNLKELNCEYVQGYFFWKPVDQETAQNILQQTQPPSRPEHESP